LISSPFRLKHVPRFLVTSITVSPGTAVGPQLVTVQINNGKSLRGGDYLFKAISVSPTNLTGIQDIAGNALDGEFYGFFPSGNNHVGGDFVAEVDALHNKIFAPKSVVGPASPVVPPGTPASGSLVPALVHSKTPGGRAAVQRSHHKSTTSHANLASTRPARPTLLRGKLAATLRKK
jgi:hypothetical protein